MRIFEENGNIIIEGSTDFDVGQTLSCGQCFHFKQIDEQEYGVVAYGRLLRIRQDREKIVLYHTDRQTYETVWKNYFDLDTDYAVIKQTLALGDESLAMAMSAMWGVRILRQEFFETLLSFIISQNKQIPHIRQIVENISAAYGPFLGRINGYDFYGFPDVHTLCAVDEAAFRSLKTGFRAPYLVDAVRAVAEGRIHESDLRRMSGEDCIASLCTIKGVGKKVASCVSLFGLGKTDSFPVDVWIKRIMETLYFKREASKEEIAAFAHQRFGAYGGYAQQYLFYYGREIKLGVDK